MLYLKNLGQLIRAEVADHVILTRDADGKITGVQIKVGVHSVTVTDPEDIQAAIDFFKLGE